LTLQGLDASILLPAFTAGVLVLLTHVPFGIQVLARGIVFIDLAIAQVAGVGVIAADALGWEPQGMAVQAAAISAALGGALLLTWTDRRFPEVQEALIGALFVLASCIGVLLLANNPHGGEHLKDLLVGQILWVNATQLTVMALVTAAVLALWRIVRAGAGRVGFYALFACAVTASVQLVGVYLVFASLILPALATQRAPTRRRLPLSLALGIAAYVIGLALSAAADLPSGPVVVLVMALLAALLGTLLARARAERHDARARTGTP